MADDKNFNEDPEEEKDDQFDDDDFGLPDLEYDELDEEMEEFDDDEVFDESAFDDDFDSEDSSEEENEENDILEEPTDDSVEETLEEDTEMPEMELDDIDLSDEEIDLDSEDEEEDWEKELEQELEQELKGEDEPAGFYEEESFDEFDTDTEEIATDSVFDSDGSDDEDAIVPENEPVTDYSPKNEAAARYAETYQTTEEGSGKGNFVKVVVIGTVLIALIAIALYVLFPGGEGESEKKEIAKKEVPAKKPEKKAEEPKKEESKPAATESTKKAEEKPKEQTPKPKAQKPAAPQQKAAGEITVLSNKQGYTYIIIGSFFDEDLARDFCNDLAADGKSPMIIPPFNNARFYRVAIAEFTKFEDARASLDSYKADYGSDIWTLKY